MQNLQQGPAQLYDGFHQAREQARQTIPATTNNPLHLFLQSLLPWNPVPNAPAPNQPNQPNPQWLVDLLNNLGDLMPRGENEEQEQ